MTIKQKIILSFLLVALSIGLLGGITFYRDHLSVEKVATHEAANIARLFMLAIRHELDENGRPLADPDNQHEIQKYVEQYKKYQRRDIVVVDMANQIIADTLPDQIGKVYAEAPADEVGQTLRDGEIRFFIEKNADYPLGIRQMVIPFDNSDGRRIGAIVMEYTPLYDEITARIKSETKWYLVFFAAALLFALLLGQSLSQNISKALATLKKAAQALADGNLDTRVHHQWPDELGLLANSFNVMAEKLQHSLVQLRLSHEQLEEESNNVKVSREDLQKSEANFRTLFENAQDGILKLSERGDILLLNESFAAMHGYTINELLAMKLNELDTPETAQLAPERLQRVMAGERTSFEVEHYCKNGQKILLEVSANIICANGERYIWGFHRDISERRRAEREREELEERLRQAQKMEAIGTLSGGIAHDFNNILSSIMGFAQLALMRPAGNIDWQEDIQQILKASARATDLVRQILTFSRRQKQEKAPVQISLIVKEATTMLRASIPTTIDIRQEIASEAMVQADSTQIHQVIVNLCTNAYHSMMERGGVLGVSLTETVCGEAALASGSELPPGRYVMLAVSDTGCGMSQATMDKIFEPYFTTKELGKGTGLGLAVVYGIAKSHHGLISVQSELGKGSTFTISLPIIEQEEASADRAGEEALPVATMAHGEKVMLVDDESDIRHYITLFLTEFGYQVVAFDNGRAAWQAFSQAPGVWDIIISDMTMPEMTGEELTSRVLHVRPDMPIIICSGYTPKMVQGEVLPAGIVAYLPKPLDMNHLLGQIMQALARA
jgi:PAS domain S-box-containing protein